jgi:homoserine dehydrogenase
MRKEWMPMVTDRSQPVRIALVGMGNLGTRFCRLLLDRGPAVRRTYGLDLRLTAVADSGGWAGVEHPDRLAELLEVKRASGSVSAHATAGHRGDSLEMLRTTSIDVLCEATPVHLKEEAEPGVSHIRTALRAGVHVVTPNKGPIVLHGPELHRLAEEHGVALRYDGTVAGGLPALPVGIRDLRGAVIEKIEAVPNLATGLVLEAMADGAAWEEALKAVRRQGALEADPSWDVDGWDAAAKLVILVRAVVGKDIALDEVAREGIRGVDRRQLDAARMGGASVRLVAAAEVAGGSVRAKVGPRALPATHPLGRLGRHGMGVVYFTDIYGTIALTIDERTPMPSAATMLRDILDIYRPAPSSRA